MVDSTSKPSKPDSLSPKEEREMRETLRDIFATDFPNPERRGCPENVEAKLRHWPGAISSRKLKSSSRTSDVVLPATRSMRNSSGSTDLASDFTGLPQWQS